MNWLLVEEIAALSCGNVDDIQVSVVGGYTDVRGDAAKNSLSLLDALHQHWAYLNLVHFCVGKYNTQVMAKIRQNFSEIFHEIIKENFQYFRFRLNGKPHHIQKGIPNRKYEDG